MHYGAGASSRLNNWLVDAENGYLLAPMQAGIRLTSGAELARYDSPPCYKQLEAAEALARRFFPLGERLEAKPWMGGRPCMPDMKPVIGPVPRQDGLWAAFGHGHQGFTLGPVTGKLLSQMMDGDTRISICVPTGWSASRHLYHRYRWITLLSTDFLPNMLAHAVSHKQAPCLRIFSHAC